MIGTLYITVFCIIACILLSGFFSASEMAFSSCNKIRVEHIAEEGDRRANWILKILERFDDFLSTILVGNNLVNIAASSAGSVLAILLFGEKYVWAVTAVITLLIIVFGETVPKIAAKKSPTKFSLRYAGPIRFLSILFKPVTVPVVFLVNHMSALLKGESDTEDEDAAQQELHSIIDTAENEDVLDEDASELVSAAIDFSDISVSEIMTARVDMMAIDINDPWKDIVRVIGASRYSRIPVYEDSKDNIIGVLSLKHILKAMIDQEKVDIRSLLLEPCFVYKTMKLPAVLSALKAAQQHLAIVTDEYGGTLGLVSMEDVLEQLVGDIWDETDTVEEEVAIREDGTILMDGDTPISDLLELMKWDEDSFDFESETVGGWCIEVFDAFPVAGQSFVYQNAVITVTKMEGHRVRYIRIEPQSPSPEPK
ncbi:MAG: HlyC/CorC family transporter [Clostridia bacterium]|nr:HlyC/CorC family transporter [Clostridia bacterium]